MLEPRPGETVLDIGCGEGKHLLLFRNMGLGTAGIDASPYMIRKATERLGGRSELRVGWAEDLPYDDNQFDLAVLINTLEFLDHPLESLREAGRVARRKVFICVINSFSWLCVLSKIQGIYQDSLWGRLRPFNIWKLQSLARSAFGDAPMEWTCIRMKSNTTHSRVNLPNGLWNTHHLPFGFFLGLSVSPYYSLRVVQHPLLVMGKARGGLMKGITTRVSGPVPSTAGNGRKAPHEDQAAE
jgi:SAM-dependent methyltransferase